MRSVDDAYEVPEEFSELFAQFKNGQFYHEMTCDNGKPFQSLSECCPGPSGMCSAREAMINGQKPRWLILSCIDSRFDPAHIFSLKANQAMVVRTHGARVGDFSLEGGPADQGFSSLVTALRHFSTIKGILVLSHHGCGANNDTLRLLSTDEGALSRADRFLKESQPQHIYEAFDRVAKDPRKNEGNELSNEATKGIVKEIEKGIEVLGLRPVPVLGAVVTGVPVGLYVYDEVREGFHQMVADTGHAFGGLRCVS